MSSRIGVVAIGRNEGERLRRCLESLRGRVDQIVYVDSGSTDGSVDMARGLGVHVVELDRSIPFTAARARNEGFARLMQVAPELEFVQFVDGDCEVVEGWIECAAQFLVHQPKAAVACGRRRERDRFATVYNRLCDIEWNTPIGEAKSCGGDAMMRVDAFKQVNGYDEKLIAGEEPEMCVRLRRKDWKIVRLDAEMTLHDAAMTQFRQWWKRMVRAGHAYAEGAFLHGSSPQRHFVRESRSIWFWGLAVPLIAAALAIPTRGLSLLALILLVYPLLGLKVWAWARRNGLGREDAILYSASCTLGKFPEAVGQLKFVSARLFGGRSELIEYKHVGAV
jgi:GT2 family glycosyltransferase